MTWAPEIPSEWAISSLSAGERYFWYTNRLSSSNICWFVKHVLALRRFLAFNLAWKATSLCWRVFAAEKRQWHIAKLTDKFTELQVSEHVWINKKQGQNLLTKLKLPCKSRTNNTILNCFSIAWRIGQVSVIYNGLRDLNSLRQWNFLRLFTNGQRAKAFKP